MSSRTQCQDCGANRGLRSDGGFTYCYSCKKNRNNKSLIDSPRSQNKITLSENDYGLMPKEAEEFLQKYYITVKNQQDFDIKYNHKLRRITFRCKPYESVWARDIDPITYPYGMKKAKWLFIGDPLFKSNIVGEAVFDSRLYIVEDIISAIRLSKYVRVCYLGGTSLTSVAKSACDNIKDIVLWLDSDRAGINASQKIRKEMKVTVRVYTILTIKDPKCYSPGELKRIILTNKIYNKEIGKNVGRISVTKESK